MRRPSKWLWVLLLSTGCFNLDLPSAPGVGAPGIVSGRLVWQRPGRLQAEAARGASVFVLGTNLAVSSDADGRFLIEGLISSEGTLLIRFDGDGDGRPERQRTFLLQQIGAGRGRQIALGDITLGQSAAISGRVVLADVADPNGYLGTPAFVPGFPLAAITQADGTFLLEGLSEGSVQLAAVRTGYQASLSGPLTLRGGEELSLALISLPREVQPVSGVLRGRVVNADGEPLSGVTVSTGAGLTTTTEGQGIWRFSGLSVDRYDVLFSAPGRLPAALYNVLLAGPDEAVTPDVVLSQGQAPGTTPSLVEDVAMERDAGSDAGTITPRDAGSDAGSDAGFDAGLDAGTDGGSDAGINYQVSIGYGAPGPIVLFPGGTLGLSAIIMPPAATPSFAWSVQPAGVVMLGNLSTGNTGMTAIAPGSFRVDLTVTIGIQTFVAPFISGVVIAPDAGVDAGTDAGSTVNPPLVINSEGATALSYWMQTEGPFAMGPISGSVLAGSTPVPSTFLYNGVTQRLVAVFDEPQPSTTITISYPNLVLIDGGVREVTARMQTTPALQFSPATVLKDGGADFNAGATYTPQGLIVVGRMFDGAGCVGCFLAASERGQDALVPANGTPPVPWRRAAAAGFTVHAWFSDTQSFKRDPFGTNWNPGPLPTGPVFGHGPVVRSVGVSGQSIQLSDYDGTGWMQSDSFGNFTSGVSFRRSSVVARPDGDLFAQVIDDAGKLEVWTKPAAGSWQQLSATLPILNNLLGGRIAATNAGLVMFVTTSTSATVLRLPTAAGSWTQVTFASKPLDLVARGSRTYLVSTGTADALEVWLIDPVSGSVNGVSVPASAPVRSAELAVGDFGELGVAWSTESGGQFQLLSAEIK